MNLGTNTDSHINYTRSLFFLDANHNQTLEVTPKYLGTYTLKAKITKNGTIVAERDVVFNVSEVKDPDDVEITYGWEELDQTNPTVPHKPAYIVDTGNNSINYNTKLPYLRFFEETTGNIGNYQQELKSAEKAILAHRFYKYVDGVMEFQDKKGNSWDTKVQYFINHVDTDPDSGNINEDKSYSNLIRLYDRRDNYFFNDSSDAKKYVGANFTYIRSYKEEYYGDSITIYLFDYKYKDVANNVDIDIELKAYNDKEGNTNPASGHGWITADVADYVTLQFRRKALLDN